MLKLTLMLVLGLAAGISGRLTPAMNHILSVLTKICLFIMIFCLAAKIGCDETVMQALPVLGIQSFFLCIGGMAGSVILMAAAGKLFRSSFHELLRDEERSSRL
jgi:hypothetical protein